MQTETPHWHCGPWRLPMDRTLIMGVLNVTPDSFSDGGRFATISDAVARAQVMIAEGADLIDVGGESTRPGALPVPAEEEERRILPVIEELTRQARVPISVDTYKAGLAERALQAGACIINDISGLSFDRSMVDVARDYGAGVVIMHMKGTPRDMQKDPQYDDVLQEIHDFLLHRKERALRAGIREESIVIDPGIGFGKRVEDNFIILRELDYFRRIGSPILVGPSRKSFIGTTLGLPVEERLEGTAAAVAAAILRGANVVRVHDVQAMRRVAAICDRIMGKRFTPPQPANV